MKLTSLVLETANISRKKLNSGKVLFSHFDTLSYVRVSISSTSYQQLLCIYSYHSSSLQDSTHLYCFSRYILNLSLINPHAPTSLSIAVLAQQIMFVKCDAVSVIFSVIKSTSLLNTVLKQCVSQI
jgi:hypothetical protein